jgi:hypothetical protein
LMVVRVRLASARAAPFAAAKPMVVLMPVLAKSR